MTTVTISTRLPRKRSRLRRVDAWGVMGLLGAVGLLKDFRPPVPVFAVATDHPALLPPSRGLRMPDGTVLPRLAHA